MENVWPMSPPNYLAEETGRLVTEEVSTVLGRFSGRTEMHESLRNHEPLEPIRGTAA